MSELVGRDASHHSHALLNYLIEGHGLSRADLLPLLGKASQVSEVLTGKLELSMPMAHKLHE